MKKIITLCLLAFSFLAGKSQFAITGGDTIMINGTTSPTFQLIGTGHCKNIGTDSLTLRWEILGDSANTGWTYTGFCDKNLCYSFTVGERETFGLGANSSGILEIHVSTGCNPGYGNVRFLLWDITDSANTVQQSSFAINVTQSTACATAGISETDANQISIYPNPVKNQLTVNLTQAIDNGQVEIFNLLGSKVYSESINNVISKSFDVSSLESGLYVTRITENGRVIATRKFTKQD